MVQSIRSSSSRSSFILLFAALSLLLLGLFISGCTPKSSTTTPVSPETPENKVIQISSGTSFGECIRYCRKEVNITSSEITYRMYSWDGSVPELTGSKSITKEQWNELTNSFDLDKFMELDYMNDVVGCPDCDDGGSEWIEVSDGTRSLRITFEFGKHIPGFEKLTEKARALRNDALKGIEQR